MKKLYLGFIILFVTVSLFATQMIIHKVDGSDIQIDISEIESITFGKTIEIDMVFVEGGTFSPDGGNYNVTLSNFYISKYEVTQADYEAVMGYLPNQNPGIGDLHPVSRVTWFDAIEFCNRLSIMNGLTPAYSYGDFGKNPDEWPDGWNTYDDYHANFSCDWTANGFMLPTEMQWEFAARGGVLAQQAGSFNDQWAGTNIGSELVNYAWYSESSGSSTQPVGTKLPNELGIYDMSGNVWNLVWDIRDYYPSGSYTDPTGSDSGSTRVLRGGSWNDIANNCTVSNRVSLTPTYTISIIGFRVSRAYF